jgi:DNA-binding MarR family transcriptional regulator
MTVDAPPSEAADLLVTVGRLNRLLRRSSGLGALGTGAVALLITLVRLGPMRLGDLATAEQLSSPAVSRVIAGLVADGHVERTQDPSDGRAFVVGATAKGVDLIARVGAEQTQLIDLALRRLDARERALLTPALAKLVLALGDLQSHPHGADPRQERARSERAAPPAR